MSDLFEELVVIMNAIIW